MPTDDPPEPRIKTEPLYRKVGRRYAPVCESVRRDDIRLAPGRYLLHESRGLGAGDRSLTLLPDGVGDEEFLAKLDLYAGLLVAELVKAQGVQSLGGAGGLADWERELLARLVDKRTVAARHASAWDAVRAATDSLARVLVAERTRDGAGA